MPVESSPIANGSPVEDAARSNGVSPASSPQFSTKSKSDANAGFLRAARAGNLEKVLDYLKNNTDINTSNANGLNALHLAAKEGHVAVVTELLKRGAAVDSATKKGNTALHIASLAGQEEVVKILVHNGASVNVQSQNGFTPLYMAAQENHDVVVRFLLANGANQSLATEDGFTPLAVALQQGHDRVVAVLLENDTRGKVRLPALHIAAKKDDCKAAALLLQSDHNPDVTSKSGFTPLHIAAHYGNENIANLLVQRGADVNFLAKHHITPLHVAAKWGKANMVGVLLDKNANLESKTRDGLTPLHCAARSGHETVVDLLLERGAPISSKTKNGLAPLHMSAQGDHVEAARVLLAHKAPVDEVTVDYLTALHVAAHCGHVRVAKLLLDRKADANARALNGFTPLHIACKKNRIKVVELLLKHGASIEATTESGLTPLHVASFMGCMNIVIFLLQHGANPNAPTMRGETPLHLAARANQTDIVRILLRNGGQVDARAREQQTPLHIASRLGNVDIVMLLLQHGAAVDAVTKDMYTPLHIAAKEGQEEVASVLLEHGASLTSPTKRGFTPLHLAAKYGNMKVAKLLLQKDAPVDAQGKNGVTPLHVASHYDHQNVALLLLDKGASPHATAKNGYTPLHIAAKKNQMDIATTLLEYGAQTNAESKAGFTPLHLSSQEGHTDMSSLLLEHQADPNYRAKNGLVPLHLCAQEDRVNVAAILVKNGAEIDPETKSGYTPLHVASHFGQTNMVRFLSGHGANVNSTTSQGYTPLHQAAQQGHPMIVSLLLENGGSPNSITNQGQTPLSIAQKLGYITVIETLKVVTETTVITTTTVTTEEKYRVQAPETMQETFMSDSEDEGADEGAMGESTYRYLTVDEMKSLGDDSLPMDVMDDHRNSMVQANEEQFVAKEGYAQFSGNYAPDNVDLGKQPPIHIGFLVSFMVDARGGAMRGCRHSGVRVIIPPRKAPCPMRITCRYLKRDRLIHPPPLMEGEALASRILELGPNGAKFLGPVIIEVPHFAALRGKEREIVVLRSDNGETWREHTLEATEEAVQEVLNESFDGEEMGQLEDMNTHRITRILTTDFPQYFAIVSRVRQEVHAIGPDGGMVSSTVVPQVQAVFPPGALTKKIKVGLQAQPIAADLVGKLLGNRVAVSPIVTVEPRRRKFHKPITLTIPVPQAAARGMINQYSGDTPTLRLLCSITGGVTRAQWEDVTGSTPLTFVNDCVSFTTTVSARFWLMDCRNVSEAAKMATDLYREAIHVPFMAKFVVFAKRHEPEEARLRVFCMTDDKEEKTLEQQEHFVEVAKSRDVEVLESKSQYLEFAGNLVPVTKSGEQLALTFRAFRENRLPFNVRVKDMTADPVGRIAFMRDPKVGRGEPSQTPICNLNLVLPAAVTPEPAPSEPDLLALQKKYGFLHDIGLVYSINKPDSIHKADLKLSDICNLLAHDWVPLAKSLEISESDINLIENEYPSNSTQQAMVMLRLWMRQSANKATGNNLEKALRKIGRDDIVNQCIFNVELVTDDLEKAVAKVQLDQSGFDALREEIGSSRNATLRRNTSLDVSYDEQDLMKESESVEDLPEHAAERDVFAADSVPVKMALEQPRISLIAEEPHFEEEKGSFDSREAEKLDEHIRVEPTIPVEPVTEKLAESEPKRDSVLAAQPIPEPVRELEPEPEPEVDPNDEVELVHKLVTEAKVEPEPEAELVPETVAELKTEPEGSNEPVSNIVPEPEVEPWATSRQTTIEERIIDEYEITTEATVAEESSNDLDHHFEDEDEKVISKSWDLPVDENVDQEFDAMQGDYETFERDLINKTSDAFHTDSAPRDEIVESSAVVAQSESWRTEDQPIVEEPQDLLQTDVEQPAVEIEEQFQSNVPQHQDASLTSAVNRESSANSQLTNETLNLLTQSVPKSEISGSSIAQIKQSLFRTTSVASGEPLPSRDEFRSKLTRFCSEDVPSSHTSELKSKFESKRIEKETVAAVDSASAEEPQSYEVRRKFWEEVSSGSTTKTRRETKSERSSVVVSDESFEGSLPKQRETKSERSSAVISEDIYEVGRYTVTKVSVSETFTDATCEVLEKLSSRESTETALQEKKQSRETCKVEEIISKETVKIEELSTSEMQMTKEEETYQHEEKSCIVLGSQQEEMYSKREHSTSFEQTDEVEKQEVITSTFVSENGGAEKIVEEHSNETRRTEAYGVEEMHYSSGDESVSLKTAAFRSQQEILADGKTIEEEGFRSSSKEVYKDGEKVFVEEVSSKYDDKKAERHAGDHPGCDPAYAIHPREVSNILAEERFLNRGSTSSVEVNVDWTSEDVADFSVQGSFVTSSESDDYDASKTAPTMAFVNSGFIGAEQIDVVEQQDDLRRAASPFEVPRELLSQANEIIASTDPDSSEEIETSVFEIVARLQNDEQDVDDNEKVIEGHDSVCSAEDLPTYESDSEESDEAAQKENEPQLTEEEARRLAESLLEEIKAEAPRRAELISPMTDQFGLQRNSEEPRIAKVHNDEHGVEEVAFQKLQVATETSSFDITDEDLRSSLSAADLSPAETQAENLSNASIEEDIHQALAEVKKSLDAVEEDLQEQRRQAGHPIEEASPSEFRFKSDALGILSTGASKSREDFSAASLSSQCETATTKLESRETTYFTAETRISSRPISSDVDALTVATTTIGSSEYDTALTSQVSSRSATSNEFYSAVSSVSSRDSMKSLDSEHSSIGGAVDPTSEASETLIASNLEHLEHEVERDLTPTDAPLDLNLMDLPTKLSETAEEDASEAVSETSSVMEQSQNELDQQEPKAADNLTASGASDEVEVLEHFHSEHVDRVFEVAETYLQSVWAENDIPEADDKIVPTVPVVSPDVDVLEHFQTETNLQVSETTEVCVSTTRTESSTTESVVVLDASVPCATEELEEVLEHFHSERVERFAEVTDDRILCTQTESEISETTTEITAAVPGVPGELDSVEHFQTESTRQVCEVNETFTMSSETETRTTETIEVVTSVPDVLGEPESVEHFHVESIRQVCEVTETFSTSDATETRTTESVEVGMSVSDVPGDPESMEQFQVETTEQVSEVTETSIPSNQTEYYLKESVVEQTATVPDVHGELDSMEHFQVESIEQFSEVTETTIPSTQMETYLEESVVEQTATVPDVPAELESMEYFQVETTEQVSEVTGTYIPSTQTESYIKESVVEGTTPIPDVPAELESMEHFQVESIEQVSEATGTSIPSSQTETYLNNSIVEETAIVPDVPAELESMEQFEVETIEQISEVTGTTIQHNRTEPYSQESVVEQTTTVPDAYRELEVLEHFQTEFPHQVSEVTETCITSSATENRTTDFVEVVTSVPDVPAELESMEHFQVQTVEQVLEVTETSVPTNQTESYLNESVVEGTAIVPDVPVELKVLEHLQTEFSHQASVFSETYTSTSKTEHVFEEVSNVPVASTQLEFMEHFQNELIQQTSEITESYETKSLITESVVQDIVDVEARATQLEFMEHVQIGYTHPFSGITETYKQESLATEAVLEDVNAVAFEVAETFQTDSVSEDVPAASAELEAIEESDEDSTLETSKMKRSMEMTFHPEPRPLREPVCLTEESPVLDEENASSASGTEHTVRSSRFSEQGDIGAVEEIVEVLEAGTHISRSSSISAADGQIISHAVTMTTTQYDAEDDSVHSVSTQMTTVRQIVTEEFQRDLISAPFENLVLSKPASPISVPDITVQHPSPTSDRRFSYPDAEPQVRDEEEEEEVVDEDEDFGIDLSENPEVQAADDFMIPEESVIPEESDVPEGSDIPEESSVPEEPVMEEDIFEPEEVTSPPAIVARRIDPPVSTYTYEMSFERSGDDEECLDDDPALQEDLEKQKRWMEMQFEQAEDIAKEVFASVGAISTVRIQALDDIEEGREDEESLNGSDRLMERLKESLSSTPEFDVLSGRRFFTRSGEHDDMSVDSLQEFERIEGEVTMGNLRRQSNGSQESLNGRRSCGGVSRSSQGDNISVNSLTEFERLERDMAEAAKNEERARQQEAMLSEIEEGHESQVSESESCETISEAGRDENDTDSDDYEQRMFEIDEIIRQAQTNVEQFELATAVREVHHDASTESSLVDKTESLDSTKSFEGDVITRTAFTFTQRRVDVEDSIDSLEYRTRDLPSEADSLDVTARGPSSLDSLEFQKVVQGTRDSLDLPLQQQEASLNSLDSVEDETSSRRGGVPDTDSLQAMAGAESSSSSGQEELPHDKEAQLRANAEDVMRRSIDSVHSSSAETRATGLESDSIMSGSITSAGSVAMVSSTDTLDATEVVASSSARRTESDVLEKVVQMPAEIRTVTFHGRDAEKQIKEFVEQFAPGQDEHETRHVDEFGNVFITRVVQKRSFVETSQTANLKEAEVESLLKSRAENLTDFDEDSYEYEDGQGGTQRVTRRRVVAWESETLKTQSHTDTLTQTSLESQQLTEQLQTHPEEVASRPAARPVPRHVISIDEDDNVEIDAREHDWRFGFRSQQEAGEPETEEYQSQDPAVFEQYETSYSTVQDSGDYALASEPAAFESAQRDDMV